MEEIIKIIEKQLEFYRKNYNLEKPLENRSFNLGCQRSLLELLKSIYEMKIKNGR